MGMNNTPRISVIVPIYKVEEYINECVDSILSQDYSDFELILVDDGSPDSCGKICDEYALKDSRVKVIHKENGGLSDARNKGMVIAKGEYITFIDSDDYIAKDYLSYLAKGAEEYGADIVEGGHTSYVEQLGTDGCDRQNKSYSVKVFNNSEALSDYLLYKTMYANAWAKLYRKALFENIEYPVDRLTEDEYTTYRLLIKANCVVCLPRKIYFYRKREGSIVRSYSERRFDVCFELPDLLTKKLKDNNLYKQPEADYKIMRVQLKIYNDFIEGNAYEDYKESLVKIQKNIKSIPLHIKEWDKKYIIIKFLISYFPGAYRKLVKILR